MSSDQDYTAFLDKANAQGTGGGGGSDKAQAQSKKHPAFKTRDQGVQVPGVLSRAVKDRFYTSDADEPFVTVGLRWEDGKGLPDEEQFAKLIEHPSPGSAEIEILDPADWDRQGEYAEVVDAVTEAGRGADVRVYKVGGEGARVEYWVVASEGGRILGVKALAVES